MPVALAPLPLKLLLHLLHRHPAAPSKDELMEALGPGTIVCEASLSQTVLEALHSAQPERVLPELAAHYAGALPTGEATTAFGYALGAAETDRRLLAFEQATRHAELALQIADESGALPATSRNDVLRLLAGGQFHAGQREAAAESWWPLVESARRTDDAAALAEAAMSLTLSNVGGREDEPTFWLTSE